MCGTKLEQELAAQSSWQRSQVGACDTIDLIVYSDICKPT